MERAPRLVDERDEHLWAIAKSVSRGPLGAIPASPPVVDEARRERFAAAVAADVKVIRGQDDGREDEQGAEGGERRGHGLRYEERSPELRVAEVVRPVVPSEGNIVHLTAHFSTLSRQLKRKFTNLQHDPPCLGELRHEPTLASP